VIGMDIVSEDIRAYCCGYVMGLCMKRAGNPMRKDISGTVPKSINSLGKAPAFSGHDAFLSGVFVYFDWVVGKRTRIQLLSNYKFINVISSQSLMHRFKEIAGGTAENVDDVDLDFKYGISFCANYRQLKIIYQERRDSKSPEWSKFCDFLEELPKSEWITSGYTKKDVEVDETPNSCEIFGDIFRIIYNFTYIEVEQLCRYHNVRFSKGTLDKFEDTSVHNVGDSCKVEFTTDLSTLKTIISQRKTHKRAKWQEFCNFIKDYVSGEGDDT